LEGEQRWLIDVDRSRSVACTRREKQKLYKQMVSFRRSMSIEAANHAMGVGFEPAKLR